MEYSKILDVTQVSRLKSFKGGTVDDSVFGVSHHNSVFQMPVTHRKSTSPLIKPPNGHSQGNIIDQLTQFNNNYSRLFYAHSKNFHNLFIETVFKNPIMGKFKVLRNFVDDGNASNNLKENSTGVRSAGNYRLFGRGDTDNSINNSILSRYRSIEKKVQERKDNGGRIKKSDIDEAKVKLVDIEKKMLKPNFNNKKIIEKMQEINRKVKLFDSIASKINYGEIDKKDFEKMKQEIKDLEKDMTRVEAMTQKKYASKSPLRNRRIFQSSCHATPNKTNYILPPPGGSGGVSIMSRFNSKRPSMKVPRINTERVKAKPIEGYNTAQVVKMILNSNRSSKRRKGRPEFQSFEEKSSPFVLKKNKSELFKSAIVEVSPITEKTNEFASPRPHIDLKKELGDICKDINLSTKAVSNVTDKLEKSLISSDDSTRIIFKHHTDLVSKTSMGSLERSMIISHIEFGANTPRGSETDGTGTRYSERWRSKRRTDDFGSFNEYSLIEVKRKDETDDEFNDDRSSYTMISEFRKGVWDDSVQFFGEFDNKR